MKKWAIREQGLVGTLFSKENKNPSCAIIVLGGSSGGLHESRAEMLAEEGFLSLALAYFGIETLPAKLNQIPLEYFERAIHIFKGSQVGLWGVSRGAELSLILGTLFPDPIHAIVAHVPSSVVYGALDDKESPAWIYKGHPLVPNAPFQFQSLSSGESEETAIVATSSFLKAMSQKQAFEASAIPVEKLKCPLLLISAEDDQMWPSSLFARQIVERLKRFHSTIQCIHHSYPRVGHAPSKGEAGLHPIMKKWFSYGGSPAENAMAALDWIRKTISFFKETLCF